MANLQDVVVATQNWIFDGCADQQERLEKAIVYTLRQKGIQNKAEMKKIKSGSLLFGSNHRCLVITGDKTFEIIVSCIPIGTFLYVSVHRSFKKGIASKLIQSNVDSDIFKIQQQDGMYSAIISCCEAAFQMLGISNE